jgi:hypothetical protein
MSNVSKAQDPAAAALSAIEEALQLNVEPEALTAQSESPKLEFHLPSSRMDAPEPTPRLPEIAQDDFAPRRAEAEPRAAIPPSALPSGARPANDDRPSAGQILQSLQSHSDSSVITVAVLASALWSGLWIGYILFSHGAVFAGSPFNPNAALAVFALIGPVIFFLAMGLVVRRAQEMRQTARSMAEVAIRLTEPEALAAEQVVTLSQAIRREVASMGDGIERALARASELETMVRAEVASLERTYGDNERRIRLLLNELASERESISVNADRVAAALGAAQNAVAQELDSATRALADKLGQTGERIAATLESKGGEIEAAFAHSGESLTRQIELRA